MIRHRGPWWHSSAYHAHCFTTHTHTITTRTHKHVDMLICHWKNRHRLRPWHKDVLWAERRRSEPRFTKSKCLEFPVPGSTGASADLRRTDVEAAPTLQIHVTETLHAVVTTVRLTGGFGYRLNTKNMHKCKGFKSCGTTPCFLFMPEPPPASKIKRAAANELTRRHVGRVRSRRIVCVHAGAVSRHYYHYFASAFVQETAVEFWTRCEVAGPGVVLVHSANLALTWWLLAEFCAELNICDNRQHHWPFLSLSLSLCISFSPLWFCISPPPFLHVSLPSRIVHFEGGGVKTKTEKKWEKWEPLMPPDQFSLPEPISITGNISWSQGCEVIQTSGPSAIFLKSVGSICYKPHPPQRVWQRRD